MEQQHDHLRNLAEIRNMMERSSRFISLSGLSGISAGIIALMGATVAFFYLDYGKRYFNWGGYCQVVGQRDVQQTALALSGLALAVFLLAVGAVIFFTTRKALKNKQKVWDTVTKRLLYHLLVPLVTGGIFCIVLFVNGIYYLIAPATLVFYGLALLNASKFTFNDIQYLGISEIVLGLVASFVIGYGLIFWALGFGALHIVYGWIMYGKYEKKQNRPS
jgi:hypothetical protein